METTRFVSAVARQAGSLDLFTAADSGMVHTAWWNDGADWPAVDIGWRDIGGVFPKGAPVSAVARGPGNLDLFVTGNDGVVYTSWWHAGADWSGVGNRWRAIGGVFPPGAPVSAVARTPGHLDLFITGNDGVVYTSWWNTGQDWSGVGNRWRPIGGVFPRGAPVAAVARAAGNLDLFITGNDGVVYTSWWSDGHDWSGVGNRWRPIGGVFPAGAPLSAVARTPGNLDLFIAGNDGNVYTSWWSHGHDWSGVGNRWRNIGGVFPPGAPVSAVARTPGNLDLFVTGNDGMVYTSAWSHGADWSGVGNRWRNIGGVFPAGNPVAAVARAPGNLDLFVVGHDARVYTSAWSHGADWSGVGNRWRALAPDQIEHRQRIVTPAGTALGGEVAFVLRRDGTYAVKFHMHGSGFVGYDFTVTATFVTPGGLTLVARHSGDVGGTAGGGPRDDDHEERGFNPLIRANWADIVNGRLWVSKDYSPAGAAGEALEVVSDIAKGVLTVAGAAAGGALGVAIALTAEAGKLFDGLGVGSVFGVIGGVVVFAAGGTLLLATAAGVAVGAVTNEMVKQRGLTPEEAAFADDKVFKGRLPADRITLTNLSGLGGRAFVAPGGDGRIYVNLGDAYDAPKDFTNKSNPVAGQLFIHELTHAWQIAHDSFLPGLVCQGVVNQALNTVGVGVYAVPPPGVAWSSMNLEAQASVVDQWFAGEATASVPFRAPQNENDPYFGYIRDNIRAGRT